MSLTYAARLEKAKLLYDKLIEESIEEYSEEQTSARKKKLTELQQQIEWLEQKTSQESASASRRQRHNYVSFGKPQ